MSQNSSQPSAEHKAPLKFHSAPENAPVISAGTPATSMFAMDACVITDPGGYHLFYSSLFVETPSGLSPFWNSDLPHEGNIENLVTAIAYAFIVHGWSMSPACATLCRPKDAGIAGV